MLPWNENWNFNDFIWVFVGLCWFRHNQLYCHLKSVPKIQWTCRGQEITEILPPDMMSGMFWFLPACLPDIFYDNGTAVFESAKYGVQSGRLICIETVRDQNTRKLFGSEAFFCLTLYPRGTCFGRTLGRSCRTMSDARRLFHGLLYQSLLELHPPRAKCSI